MRRLLLVSSILSLLPCGLPGAGAGAAESFTAAQRAEIVRIVREALKADPSILREALSTLQADEAQQQQAQTEAAIRREHAALFDAADPVEGNPSGGVTMVVFYDTRCPYCRRMLPIFEQLVRSEPDLRIAVKDLPILGATSQLESRALLAAQRQGGYFKLRDSVMHSPAQSTRETLRAEADRLGLDGGRLLADLDDPAIKSRLEANVALAEKVGVQGTPAIIVGTRMIAGAADLAELRQAVAAARRGG